MHNLELAGQLRGYAGRVLFWSVPVTLLWWFSLPVLLPSLAVVADSLLQHNFARARAELSVRDMHSWYIETRLLVEPITAGASKHFWHIDAGNPVAMTLGLPFMWALMLASPTGMVVKILIGTATALFGCVLLLWLKLSAAMVTLLTSAPAFQVYVMRDLYLHHAGLPAWWATVLPVVEICAAYLVMMILPIVLAGWLNRGLLSRVDDSL